MGMSYAIDIKFPSLRHSQLNSSLYHILRLEHHTYSHEIEAYLVAHNNILLRPSYINPFILHQSACQLLTRSFSIRDPALLLWIPHRFPLVPRSEVVLITALSTMSDACPVAVPGLEMSFHLLLLLPYRNHCLVLATRSVYWYSFQQFVAM